MTLTNDCTDCLNAFEDVRIVAGRAAKVMRCEFQHTTFPHATNCPTCQPEDHIAHALDIGGGYVSSDD